MAKQEQAQPFRSVVLATDFSLPFGLQDDMQRYSHNIYDAKLVVVHAFTLNSRL
ncbi:MAG: hypothetical protein ABSF85_04440 [Terriglobales bacterium]|jgi:hypothetical protein